MPDNEKVILPNAQGKRPKKDVVNCILKILHASHKRLPQGTRFTLIHKIKDFLTEILANN